jgi:Predicted membrane protein
MTTLQLLTSTWALKPSVLIICAALVLGYGAALRFRFSKETVFFIAGVFLLLLALLSPLDTLGHDYLFSAHMLQHILLLLIVPLSLLLGIPSWLAKKALVRSHISRVERVLGHPLLAWLLGIGAMWIWHIPALYNATMENEGLHVMQQLSLPIIGIIFWWPVIAPLEELRLAPLISILYTFFACIGCTTLGIIITFASIGLYPHYLHPNDTLGILSLIRNGWGISPEVDQQFGGLLMWVPGCLIYISIIMLTLARWYSSPEEGIISTSPASTSLQITVSSVPKEEI